MNRNISPIKIDFHLTPGIEKTGRKRTLCPTSVLAAGDKRYHFHLDWADLASLLRPGSHTPCRRAYKPDPSDDQPTLVRTSHTGDRMEWHFKDMPNAQPITVRTGQFRSLARDCLLEAKKMLISDGRSGLVPANISLMDLLFMDAPGSPDLLKVISGGQTGVDRAALDAAMAGNICCCGWCPKGRRAEDGAIPARYPMMETPAPGYPDRTRRNILAADGTLILNTGQPEGGTKYTLKLIRELSKSRSLPSLLIQLDGMWASPDQAVRWIRDNGITRLNIAGPREGKSPGITKAAYDFLMTVFQSFAGPESC